MEEVLEFIVRYKYLVLFGLVFAEQIGLPVPALPFLLAAGALVRGGQLPGGALAAQEGDPGSPAAGRRAGGVARLCSDQRLPAA